MEQQILEYAEDMVDPEFYCNLQQLAAKKDISAMLLASRQVGLIPVQFDDTMVARTLKIMYSVGLAINDYSAPPLKQNLNLFIATEGRQYTEAVIDWNDLASSVEITNVHGDHNSMMEEPHIRDTGQALTNVLRAIHAAAKPSAS